MSHQEYRIQFIALNLLLSCTAACTLPAKTTTDEADLISRSINSQKDADELIAALTEEITSQTAKRVKMVEKRSGKTFIPSEAMVTEQQKAQKQFKNNALPRLTSMNKVRTIDIQQIGSLAPHELDRVLKSFFHFVTSFPPRPGREELWARTLAPVLSFDTKNQELFTELLTKWIDLLLETKNVKALQEIASAKDANQGKETMVKLRKKFASAQHNASQLLYGWLQAAVFFGDGDPLGAFLQQATTNPDAMYEKFRNLMRYAKGALKEANSEKPPTDDDALGFSLLSLATLYAPDPVFESMNSTKQMNTKK